MHQTWLIAAQGQWWIAEKYPAMHRRRTFGCRSVAIKSIVTIQQTRARIVKEVGKN